MGDSCRSVKSGLFILTKKESGTAMICAQLLHCGRHSTVKSCNQTIVSYINGAMPLPIRLLPKSYVLPKANNECSFYTACLGPYTFGHSSFSFVRFRLELALSLRCLLCLPPLRTWFRPALMTAFSLSSPTIFLQRPVQLSQTFAVYARTIARAV